MTSATHLRPTTLLEAYKCLCITTLNHTQSNLQRGGILNHVIIHNKLYNHGQARLNLFVHCCLCAFLKLLKIRGDVLLFKYFVSELKPGRMGNS